MSIPHQFVVFSDSLLQLCYIRLYSLQVPSLPALFGVFSLCLQGFYTSRLSSEVSVKGSRRRPTFPHSCPCSIIGAEGLNCRVRNGNGCLPLAKVTVKCLGWKGWRLEVGENYSYEYSFLHLWPVASMFTLKTAY